MRNNTRDNCFGVCHSILKNDHDLFIGILSISSASEKTKEMAFSKGPLYPYFNYRKKAVLFQERPLEKMLIW